MSENFEKKAIDYYGEVIINKDLVKKAGFSSRSIPNYVGEWILFNFLKSGEFDEESRNKISRFITKFFPQKAEKETYKNRLLNMETVQLLDNYSVEINLKTGNRFLRIPFLDINEASIPADIVDKNELLLKSGVWGVGELFYVPPQSNKEKGSVTLRNLKPFQIGKVDIDYYIESRKYFTTEEWINLLISTMGYNPYVYKETENKDLEKEKKIALLTRLLPLIEPRVNLVELAPKGTGKSFVFSQISRYSRLIGGGKVSPAVMFYNNQKNTVGLITRYDVVVLDEVQSIQGDSKGELVAGLKTYLESGKFSRGNTEGTSECGFVMLGNIDLSKGMEVYEERSFFEQIPNFLQETAFIDRIHGIIPGWIMPRITDNTPSIYNGFKGDFFAEILHSFRGYINYTDYVTTNMKLKNCDDLRDRKAITRLATAYLKLLFPNLESIKRKDFVEYCVKPAVALRQRVRTELHKLDKEYKDIQIEVEEDYI